MLVKIKIPIFALNLTAIQSIMKKNINQLLRTMRGHFSFQFIYNQELHFK